MIQKLQKKKTKKRIMQISNSAKKYLPKNYIVSNCLENASPKLPRPTPSSSASSKRYVQMVSA